MQDLHDESEVLQAMQEDQHKDHIQTDRLFPRAPSRTGCRSDQADSEKVEGAEAGEEKTLVFESSNSVVVECDAHQDAFRRVGPSDPVVTATDTGPHAAHGVLPRRGRLSVQRNNVVLTYLVFTGPR